MIKFEKYQAVGNDFIIVDNLDNSLGNFSTLARAICDRHFGIGADGLLVLEPSVVSDGRMGYYNSDGSVASMCGNGIRCLAKYMYDHKIAESNTLNIETLAGILKVELITNDQDIEEIKVNLGKPEYILNDSLQELRLTDLVVAEQKFKGTLVTVGVTHLVILGDKFNTNDAITYGPLLEKYFEERANVDFVEVLNQHTIKVITWEKGAGLTLACGTGAAASALVGLLLKKVKTPVKVIMPGGEVKVSLDNNEVILTGKAEKIGEGIYFGERD